MYRLVGIAMLLGVLGAGITAGKDTVSGLLTWIRVVMQQREMVVIRDMVIAERTMSGHYPFPGDIYPNEAFNAFLRDKISAKGRDPARDMWGHFYFIALARWGHRVLSSAKEEFALQSAGPDGMFATADDVTYFNFY